MDFCVVFVTASGPTEAEKISKALLKEKLAACVNIVRGVRSRYWWKGKIEKASESLIMIKTRKSKVPRLIRKVKKIHSYAVPEVIALPILQGNSDYLLWVGQSLR